jgi:DNA polymerase-4/protein ImuB
MAIACVSIPHFALRVAILEQPELDGMPLVLAAPPGERPVVIDATPEAAARGIRPGLGLREVPALCPAALILPPHPLREAHALHTIMLALEACSPLVEADADHPGCFYVDLAGLDRRLGSPAHAARQLLQAVSPVLRPRAGIAPGKFAARIAAGAAPPGGQVILASTTADFLSKTPVTWLPLPPAKLRQLERLGVRSLGDLTTLPVTAVQARFGPIGRRAWELASGRDDTTVHSRLRPETVSETLDLPDPITSREMLLVALTRLVTTAFDRPALRNRHVRQLHLQVAIEGNRSWEQRVTLREPGGLHRVLESLTYRLQAIMLPGPIERLTIELSGLITATGHQELLPGLRSRRPRQLAEASRHLKQRYGVSGLFRVVEVEPWSRIPERRQALLVYDP